MLVELIEEWCKVSWSAKSDLRQCLSVGSKDVLDASWDFRVLRISIDSEAVINTVDTHVSRDTSKSEDWETLVMIIWLNYLTNLVNRTLILIIVSKVVERGRA